MNNFIHRKVLLIALAGAFFVSIVYGLPYILIKKELASNGVNYHPITVYSDWDEALVYAPLTQEAAEKLKQADPALIEHQNTPLLLPPSGPIFLGALTRLVGIESLWILVDFFLPPIIFLLFFAIIYALSKSTLLSFFVSIIFIFTRELASLIPFSELHQLKRFLLYFKPYISSPVEFRLPFDRLFSSEWTFIPLTLFFLLLIIALLRRRTTFYILSGVAYGFLFYSYFYDWVAVSIMLGVFVVLAAFQRNKILARQVATILVVGLAVSIFYWVSFWQVSHLPYYEDIKNRAGLEVGRVFQWYLIPHYILWLLCAGWLFLKNQKNPLSYLAIAIFIGSFAVMNVQVFIGYVPQPVHFLQYPLALSLFIAYFICCMRLWENYEKYFVKWKIYLLAIVGSGAILVSIHAIQWQVSYAHNNEWRYVLEETIDDSFEWMRTHLELDAVVLSPSFITNAHLMIMTPAKVFYPPTAFSTSASNREIIERYIIAVKLFGLNDRRVKELFSYDYLTNLKIEGWRDGNVTRALLHNYLSDRRSYNEVEEIVLTTLDQWNKDPEILLTRYTFQYVYIGPNEKEISAFSKKKFPRCLEEVYKNEKVNIYRICRNS